MVRPGSEAGAISGFLTGPRIPAGRRDPVAVVAVKRLRGDVLILGCDARRDDADVPAAMVAGARAAGLLVDVHEAESCDGMGA